MIPFHLKQLQQRLVSKRFLIVFVWIAAILGYCLSPLRFLLNRETLVAFLQTLGFWSPILFAGLYAVSTQLREGRFLGCSGVRFTQLEEQLWARWARSG